MANKHRRHSSVDTLGWTYTNRVRDEQSPELDRSTSTRDSSVIQEALLPTLKRQSSVRLNPGDYIAGCFGPRHQGPESQRPILSDHRTSLASGTSRRPPRSRSISLGNFEFGFGSMRFKERQGGPLAERAEELDRQVATHKQRFVQPGGRWVLQDDAEYYLKPPAWKQALRKLRAEAQRRVHPAREHTPVNYDAESYAKNFDDSGRVALSAVVNEDADNMQVQRFDGDAAAIPATKLVTTTTSVPAVLPAPFSTGKDDIVPIWERRVAARPIAKLELTRSI